MAKRITLAFLAAAAIGIGAALAQAQSVPVSDASLDALRGATPLDSDSAPPPMPVPRNGGDMDVRNYPEQPPLIPHSIEGYQIDLNSNKCLSCHARARTGESGAPMLSITHFMDRDGQVLAAVSPRRYFCTQCHVSQYDVKPAVQNDFVDIDSLLHAGESGAGR